MPSPMGKEARGRARPGRPRASARFYAAGPGRTNPSRRVARSLGRACVSSPRSPWPLKPRAGHCQPRDQLEARAGAAGSMRAAAPQRWRQGKGLRLDHPCRAGRTLLARNRHRAAVTRRPPPNGKLPRPQRDHASRRALARVAQRRLAAYFPGATRWPSGGIGPVFGNAAFFR